MSRAAELRAQRRNTRAFIDADPFTLRLQRVGQLTPDGAGGYERPRGGATLPVQIVKMIPVQNGLLRRTNEGEEVVTTHVVVGMPDLDIERGDWFWIGGEKIEVSFLYPENGYERRAECAGRG